MKHCVIYRMIAKMVKVACAMLSGEILIAKIDVNNYHYLMRIVTDAAYFNDNTAMISLVVTISFYVTYR